jgi:hypothetical protein
MELNNKLQHLMNEEISCWALNLIYPLPAVAYFMVRSNIHGKREINFFSLTGF